MEIVKQSSIQDSSDEEFQDDEEIKEGGNYELGISEVPSNISSPEIPYPQTPEEKEQEFIFKTL